MIKHLIAILFLNIGWQALQAQCSPAPTLTATNNSSFCAGQGNISFNITPNLANGCILAQTGMAYELIQPNGVPMSNQNGTFSNLAPMQGNYTARVRVEDGGSGNCPCQSGSFNYSYTSNTVTVYPTPTPPNINNNNGVHICSGETATLSASHSSSTTGNFVWSNNQGNTVFIGAIFQTPALNTTAIYHVVEDLGGCVSSPVSVVVNVDTLLPPVVDGIDTICAGASTNFIITNLQPGQVGKWYADAQQNNLLFVGSSFQTPNLTSASTTHYWVSVSSGNCESALTQVSVVTQTLPAPIAINQDICTGSSVMLQATAQNNGLIYWYNSQSFGSVVNIGNFFNIPSVSNSTTYWVEERVGNCISPRSSLNLNALPLPNPYSFSANDGVCEGGSLSLVPDVISSVEYHWTGPNSFESDTITPVIENVNPNLNQGYYELKVINMATGCQSEVHREYINITPKPTISLMDSISISEGDEYQIVASGGSDYSWYPVTYLNNSLIPNPIFSAPKTFYGEVTNYMYNVSVSSSVTGCEASDSILITVLPQEDGVVIHDIFTPNGDGVNETWDIDYVYTLGEIDINVFDINNQIVYHYRGSDYNANKWSGHLYNGQGRRLVPDGTYWYYIKQFSTDNNRVFSGGITILTGEK